MSSSKYSEKLTNAIIEFVNSLSDYEVARAAANAMEFGVGVSVKFSEGDVSLSVLKTRGGYGCSSLCDRQNGIDFYIYLPYVEGVYEQYESLYDPEGGTEDEIEELFESLCDRREELLKLMRPEINEMVDEWTDYIEQLEQEEAERNSD